MLHVIPESFINTHQGRGQNNASLEHTLKQETASTEVLIEPVRDKTNNLGFRQV